MAVAGAGDRHGGHRRFPGRHVVGDLLDVGETIVGVGRIYYKGQGSGIEADSPAGWVFRFRDGKVVYFHAFRDPETVFATVGLAE